MSRVSPQLKAYLLAPASVAGIAFLRWLMLPLTGPAAPMLLMLFAPLGCALYGGLGPGLLAMLLALAAGRGLFMPLPLTDLPDRQNLLRLTMYTLQATGATLVCAMLKRNREALTLRLAELRDSQTALRAAKDAAEAASRAKTQFLANMSHEIRTPLGVIIGFADLLLDERLSDEGVELATVIKRNGEQLHKIVNEVLDVSKVEVDQLVIETLAFSLSELLSEALSLLTFMASEKGLALKVTQHGLLPERIATDPTRLRQILLNVVGNAVKFTDRGRVDVGLRLLTESGEAERILEIVVQDSGPGLTPEQQQRLFQPFVQGDESMTRRHGGTGLGLYLAKRLANLLGGDVALVSSGVGSGSTFRITVPCTVLEGPPVAPRPEADGLAVPEALRPLSGLRVLLVEDVADNRHLVSRFLTLAGASVDTADDGLDGLNKALAGAYDVVLMDMQMPRLDGVEATRRLRQNGYGGAVIALTAHARQEDQARCLAAGCDDFLSKPVHREQLIDKLAALARRQPPALGHKPETH